MSSGHNRTPGGRRPGPVLQPERQGRPHRVPGPPAGGFLFLPASRRDGVRLSGDGGLGLRGAPPSLPNDPRRHASRRSSLSSGTERGGAEPPRRGWARRPGADARAAEAARPAPCSSLQISRLRGRRAGSSPLAIAVAQPAARDMRPPLFALMPGPRGRCLLTPSGSPGAAAAHPASLPLTSAVDFMLISSYKFSFLRLPNDICFS